MKVVPILKSIAPTLEIPWQTKTAEKRQRRIGEAYLRAVRATGIRSNVIVSRSEVLSGQPATAIIRFIIREGIDLLVCTNRSTTGPMPWRHGSVAMKLVRNAPCDTLLVRTDAEEALEFSRILVALDGSDLAERALVPAVALSKAMSSAMFLLRVTPPVAVAIGPDEAEVLIPKLRRQIEEYLLRIRERWMNGRIIELDAQTGPVGKSILDHAKFKKVDLIVLGSHGASKSSLWELGGVTNKVIQGARTAVLIVRPGLIEQWDEERYA